MIHHLIDFIALVVFMWFFITAPAVAIIITKFILKKLDLYDD